jgi:hypothetical protein
MPLETRADLLKYALAAALRTAAKIVRGARQGLTASERERLAQAAVDTVRNLPDDPWKLTEPLPKRWGVMTDLGSPTPDGWYGPADSDKLR